MNILVATGLYPPESGGPATYAALLKDCLPAYGFNVSVLPFSSVRRQLPGIRHAMYFWKCFTRALRADVVYAQDTVSVGFPAALAALFARRIFLVRVPGDYAWEQARQRFGVADGIDEFQNKTYGVRVWFLRALQRFVVRRAVAVVAPSEYVGRMARGWGAKNVHIIYSSIEPPAPAAVLRPDGFLIVSAGRNVPWKGFEALKRVVGRENRWRLFIASGLPRAETLGWIKAANVFVLNSTYEGLSHLLVEAMTLGTPIVATRIGGNPEVVGDDGLLVPQGDDEALYRAIKSIEKDPAAAATRVANGRARAKSFSADVALDKLTKLLRSV